MTTSFSPTKFIEDALFCTTPLSLSYTDPDQKWTIRQHLVSLFQECPYLAPGIAHFTHDDGTEAKLLNARGNLPINPPIPVTIWVHELYPYMPPMVYVTQCAHPISPNHPFIDPSGAAVSSYLINWLPCTSTLLGLVRNLIRLFSMTHPFCNNPPGSPDSDTFFGYSGLISRQEAVDRLTCSIYYDVVGIRAKAEEDIENLSRIQAGLRERGEQIGLLLIGLDQERKGLRRRVDQVWAEYDSVLSWLTVYGGRNGAGPDVDDVFEFRGMEEVALLDCVAADHAADDVMYALDRAVEAGVVRFGEYMKLVRSLARDQFLWRARFGKLRGRDGVV